jgi:hypothetical protein
VLLHLGGDGLRLAVAHPVAKDLAVGRAGQHPPRAEQLLLPLLDALGDLGRSQPGALVLAAVPAIPLTDHEEIAPDGLELANVLAIALRPPTDGEGMR